MSLRLIIDPPKPGPVNMAADETLLHAVGSGTSPATLRCYTWSEPTLSLGYFQKYADVETLDEPERRLPVVRRLTGGGAILHDRELTYSIALPTDHELLAGGANRLYELAHDAVIQTLDELGIKAQRGPDPLVGGESDDSGPTRGPFFCFARRHRFDVLIANDKVAGSAQRRTREAVLQHGSIITQVRFTAQPAASVDALSCVALTDLALRFAAHWTDITGFDLIQGAWQPDETADIETRIPKYAGNDWTKRR